MRRILLAIAIAFIGCGSGAGYELEAPEPDAAGQPDQLAPDANLDAGQVDSFDAGQPDSNDAGQPDVEEIWDSAGSGWKDGAGPDTVQPDVIHIDSPDTTNDAAIDTASETYAPYDDAGIQDTGVQAGTCTAKNRLETKCVLGGSFGLSGSKMITVICDGQLWQPAKRVSNSDYECLAPCYYIDNKDHSHQACDSYHSTTNDMKMFMIRCVNVKDGYAPIVSVFTIAPGYYKYCTNGMPGPIN